MPAPPVLEISREEGRATLSCSGEFDASAMDALLSCGAVMGSVGEPRGIVDLTRVDYIDISCLRTILSVSESLSRRMASVEVLIGEGQPARLLRTSLIGRGLVPGANGTIAFNPAG